MRDLVSVIMPVYNNEKYLSQAIESILNQSYDNIELLILDDGSEDESLSIIEKYALENKNIRVISRDNKGISNCICELIKYTNGDYIARMNGDDVSYIDRIETQVKYLKDNNDIALVGTYVDVEIIGDKNNDDIVMCENIFNFKIDKGNPSIKILNGNKICHGTFLGKADVFKQIHYNINLKMYEDVDFIFNVIKQQFKLDVITKKLYLNRVTPKFIYEQKHLDIKYNRETLTSKIKFLQDKLSNKNIYIIGRGNECQTLYDILDNSQFKIDRVIHNITTDELRNLNKNNYVIILDRDNSENIENNLQTLGMKNLVDFITL